MDLWSRTPAPKKRTSRACDLCRRKKIRCDGADMADNRCSGCISHNVECTYDAHNNKKKSSGGTDQSFEEKLTDMEGKVDKSLVAADEAANPDPENFDCIYGAAKRALAMSRAATTGDTTTNPNGTIPFGLSILYPNTRRVVTDPEEEVEQSGIPELEVGVSKINLGNATNSTSSGPFFRHYHGRASTFSYYVWAKVSNRGSKNSEYNVRPDPVFNKWKFAREQYWVDAERRNPEFLKGVAHPSKSTFPPKDQMRPLLQLFFRPTNFLALIIDRPAFFRRFEASEYLTSDSFAGLMLTMLSLTSKYSKEVWSRTDPADKYSSGDKYAEMVHPFYRSFQGTVNLEELQGMTLFAFFQFLSSRHHPAWVTIGTAVRHAQDVGAHRRRPETLTRETEFWKRTCWLTHTCDVMLSTALGRAPMGIMDEIELDYCVEIEDDFHLRILGANCMISLCRILSNILSLLYCITKPRLLSKILGDDYDQRVVMELDSALNEWFETIPDELKWNPEMMTDVQIELAASMYVFAHNARQLIHRPYIPSPQSPETDIVSPRSPTSKGPAGPASSATGRGSSLSFPSLAICTNAARSAANVLNVARQKGLLLTPGAAFGAFASGITLLIATWGAKNSGIKIDYATHVGDIDKCLKFLLLAEDVYLLAGRTADILRELASFGGIELSFDVYTPPGPTSGSEGGSGASWKRGREDDDSDVPDRLSRYQPRSEHLNRSASGGSGSPNANGVMGSPPTDGPPPSFASFLGRTKLFDGPFENRGSGSSPSSNPAASPPMAAMDAATAASLAGAYNYTGSGAATNGRVVGMPGGMPTLSDPSFSSSSVPWDPSSIPYADPTGMYGGFSPSTAGEAGASAESTLYGGLNDPNLWMSAPGMEGMSTGLTPGGIGLGMGGGAFGPPGMVDTEAMGLWSFAPQTFGWEQWGTLVNSIKQGEQIETPSPPSQHGSNSQQDGSAHPTPPQAPVMTESRSMPIQNGSIDVPF